MKKISVISGGASGLGLAIAELLVKSGKDVLILGRDNDKLNRAAKRLSRISVTAHVSTLVCNIGKESDVRMTGKFLKDHKIVTEYLFNNAGRGLFSGAGTSTSEMINDVFEPNLKGLILLTSEILRITPEKEDLTIINIMSTSSLSGRDQETIYCAAKWGARGYTEALRTELKGTKRNIIAVYPGGMKTDFWKVPGQNRDISGFMDPKEVAEIIVPAVLVKDKLLVTDITINRKK
ncbi:MAG: SDR family oxidoreductase [Bacteroidales bacterium]|jgi:short-subunit dehydrogenase|nr:SDR family oxidoreductase [Bacteroidales bacterium]